MHIFWIVSHWAIGQVLKHENLGNYLSSKVPSLKEFQSKKTNGQLKNSSLRLLVDVMEFLERWDCFFFNGHVLMCSCKRRLLLCIGLFYCNITIIIDLRLLDDIFVQPFYYILFLNRVGLVCLEFSVFFSLLTWYCRLRCLYYALCF